MSYHVLIVLRQSAYFQQKGPQSSSNESVFLIKPFCWVMVLNLHVFMIVYLDTVLTEECISDVVHWCGFLSSWPWFLRWEGSTLLSNSLYLGRMGAIDNLRRGGGSFVNLVPKLTAVYKYYRRFKGVHYRGWERVLSVFRNI